MSELYKFGKLDAQLTKWGFPIIKGTSGFQPIRVDFKKAYNKGKIEFREDGIYLIHEGREWKGYMYMPTYRVTHYKDVSRFHLTRCSTIDNFITKGMFDVYYIWSNHKCNDITDRDTGEIHKDQTLQLCSNCREKIIEITDTENFFETLDTAAGTDTTDIEGYPLNWNEISRKYRKSKDYTCEKCGVKSKRRIDDRYWHVHHKDGNKTNNQKSNLECLCVLCHSNADLTHEENFTKPRMKPEVDAFVKQYIMELQTVKNPYWKKETPNNKTHTL